MAGPYYAQNETQGVIVMASPDLFDIEGNAEPIVQAIGREAVEVYVFFASGSVVVPRPTISLDTILRQ